MLDALRTATLQEPIAGMVVLFILWACMVGSVITIAYIVHRARSRKPVLGYFDDDKNFDRWNRW